MELTYLAEARICPSCQCQLDTKI